MPELPGYADLRLVSTGGQGIVFCARRIADGQAVAIKQLRSRMYVPSLRRGRMEREIDSLESLDHPRILPFVEEAEDGAGNPVLVTRWLEGGTMKTRIPFGGEGKLSVEDGVQKLIDLAEAVAFAHAKGMVHRDIKPSNILFDEHGEVFLADFGLVKVLRAREEEELTAMGAVLGTMAYIAPELIKDKDSVSPQCDVYGLGGVLYEGLCGRPPHPLQDGERLLHAPAPSAVTEDAVDEKLERIAMHALAANPQERYSDVRSLIEDLTAYLRKEEVQAPKRGAWTKVKDWAKSAQRLTDSTREG